jgi:ATP-binding cassette, subfamily B, bacterial MsbA
MKNFYRAVYDSLHHWPAIVIATICSVGVAALWSANIGALLPVIELTLTNDSLQDSLASGLSEKRAEIEALTLRSVEQQRSLDLTHDRGELPGNKALEEELGRTALQIEHLKTKLAWKAWIHDLSVAYLPRDRFETICCIMSLLIVSTMVKHLMMLGNELLIGDVSTKIVRSLRMNLFAKSLRLDRPTYQALGTSGLLSSITYSADALALGLINFLGAAIREPLRIVACLIGASFICWRLLLISMVMAPVLLLVISFFNRRLRKIATQILGRNAGFHEIILESLSNIMTVQAYNMEQHEQDRFQNCTHVMRRASMNMIFYSGLSKPFTELVGVSMIAITVCAGAYLVVNHQTHILMIKISDEPMTVSRLFVFFGLLIGASDPLRKLSGVFTSIYTGAIAADSLYHLLDNQAAIPETANPVAISSPHSQLQLKDVSFQYHPGTAVLKKVNLTIPFGKTVAILGANGSGKSTLIQLLGRFYDPLEGQLLLDGIDYKELAIDDVRGRIALVSQTTELFNRTVMENIQYGSPDSTPEEAIQAAKLAHAHEFISTALTSGYDTVVGQAGQRLSGGQRQRIALARAILRKPEILILDESTSQVDMSSELQIRDTLSKMKGQLTIVIITHREALAALADQTYLMTDGQLRLKTDVLHVAA